MTNLRILARNQLAADGVVIEPSPAMLNAYHSRLNKRTERGLVARTTSLASQDISLYLPSAKSFNMLAATRHNWTTAGTLRTFAYNGASPKTTLHDSTALAVFNISGLDTELDNYLEASFAGYKNTVHYFTEQSSVEEVLYRYVDAANPDGYLDVTHLWGGKCHELVNNPAYGGLELTLLNGSKLSRADDWTYVMDAGPSARRIKVNLDLIQDAQDLDTLLGISRYLGMGGECWLDVYPDETGAKGIYHRGAFCLVDSPTFNPHQYGLSRNSLVFEES